MRLIKTKEASFMVEKLLMTIQTNNADGKLVVKIYSMPNHELANCVWSIVPCSGKRCVAISINGKLPKPICRDHIEVKFSQMGSELVA